MARIATIIAVFCCCFFLETSRIPGTNENTVSACVPPAVQLSAAQASGVDATEAWNQVCTQWGFPQAPVGNPNATFAQVWNPQGAPPGTLFNVALAGVVADVNEILAVTPIRPDGDDTFAAPNLPFNYSIQNW